MVNNTTPFEHNYVRKANSKYGWAIGLGLEMGQGYKNIILFKVCFTIQTTL